MGHMKFLIFYVFCGVAAALLQAVVSPNSSTPMIGASGAVSGVLVLTFSYFLKLEFLTLVVLFFFITFFHIPAGILIGFWFLSQITNAYFSDPGSPGVAWYAHIGGFFMGLTYSFFLKRRNLSFFLLE